MSDKIDPNKVKTRDWALVNVIKGATKAGVHKDQKKEANRTASRGKKMSRADRGQEHAQQNTMQLAELKHLKAQIAIKDQRIRQLEEMLGTALNRIKDAEAGATPVEKQILKLLTSEQIEKIAATDDLIKAIVDSRTGK